MRGPQAVRAPGAGLGALVGLLTSAALAAVLFLVGRLTGAPFPPFDLFDGLTRVLPGPLVTFGIDAMVGTIVALNLGSVADVAKTVERGLAVALFLAGGAGAGALLFAALRGRPGVSAVRPGLLLGLALAVALVLVGLAVDTGTAARSLAAAAWLAAAGAAWGAALGGSRDRLVAPPSLAPDAPVLSAPTSPPGSAPAASPEATARGTAPTAPTATRAGAAPRARAEAGDARPRDAEVERLDRRRFLIRLGGATAVVTVAGAGLGALLGRPSGPTDAAPDAAPAEGWAAENPLPNADATVEPAPGTRPEYTVPADHYRIDIDTVPPAVDADAWRLRVTGLVDEPLELTLEALRAYPPLHRFVTLSCISNRVGGDLIGTTRWTGVPLARLLPDLGLRDEASHLRIASVDGFYEYLPIATALVDERVMLAYAWDGRPLPRRNGFPLRLYVPDVYGMKQPKWIDRIEAVASWDEGYWVARGWDAEARVRATSVIDTVAVDAVAGDPSGGARVPIGGIAHAGARGVERVEVRVDDGAWQQARLRAPLSDLTWVVWRYDWLFEPGAHDFTVRCVDGNGEAQIVEPAPPHPSGATGLHRVRERL